MDVFHVRGARPHVLGGDVAPTERLHEAAMGAEHRLAVLPLVVAHEDGLAAAEVDAGHRGLVGHPAGEPERVGDGIVRAGILPESGAAECRAERGIVDRDDAEVAGTRLMAERDLLVVVLGHRLLEVHGSVRLGVWSMVTGHWSLA